MHVQSLDRSEFEPSAVPAKVVPLFDFSSPDLDPIFRVALIGTFAPRKCGIATFTADIVEQVEHFHPGIGFDVYALDQSGSHLHYTRPRGVVLIDDTESFHRAARGINESGVDAVWLQHEFGIFGDRDGEAVCDFVDRIAAPLIVTFHTVLGAPSSRQLAIMRHLVTRASRIMVMSQQSRDLLVDLYGASSESIDIVPHGAPDRPFGREDSFKQRLGLDGRNVLMTFGLLGPGKGLERVIEAMPAIVARHPDTVYRIVGATHPNLIAEEGEAYRERLQGIAADLGVENHILWENRFLETDELLDQLEACDIYLTPYPNLQQSTSGTLSYAVALGKAVVSTPYIHASELLGDGAGVLVEPDSPEALASAIIALLDDRAALSAIKRRAYDKGRKTIWPAFARASAELIATAAGDRPGSIPITAQPGLSALLAMSDGTGMLQHAIGIVPDRNHGYCLDDNARALMVMNVAAGLTAAERKARSITYASFVQHAWNADEGRFRNFMHFDRSWLEDTGSEDSNGRALWALGHTIEYAPDPDLRKWASQWFDRAAPLAFSLEAPRATAFAMLGAAAILRKTGPHEVAERILDQGGAMLDRLLDHSRRPDWAWFEAVLGYDNPRLSQALIEAGELRGRPSWSHAGIESLAWIADRQIAASGHFRPVGSETFGRPHSQLPFDQQALEAQAAIEAAEAAYRVSGMPRWIDHAVTAYGWYFGANDRGTALVELADGRCRDGVTPRGVNENCGAESILAFQLAHYALTRLCRPGTIESATGEPIEPRKRTTEESTSSI